MTGGTSEVGSEAVLYYRSLYFTWWDLGGMVIQEINMGGINPTVCRPNPRPTTLRFFCHINSSVPKTKFYVCEWDLGGMKD